jgi:hypothetical protein
MVKGDKMKQLKILFAILILLIVGTNPMVADSVTVNVSNTHITNGEEVIVDIVANGNNIVFPEIDKIGRLPANRVGETNEIIMGSTSRHTKSVSYAIYPDTNMTIPPFEVTIDGKIKKTNSVKIYVGSSKNGTDTRNGYHLTMTSSKKEVYEGEPFWMQIAFFMPKSNDVIQDNKFSAPSFDGFFVKSDQKFIPKRSSDGTTYVINYILTPQKSGELTIPAPQMKIGIKTFKGARDPWGFFNNEISWRNFKGNPITIKAKSTPSKIDLIGSFVIEATVDAKSIIANKPINYTITIHGKGGLEDIEDPKFDLPGVTVYSDDGQGDSHVQNGEVISTWEKKYTFIADHDFTIPSIKKTVFDSKTGKTKVMTTESFNIKVNGGVSTPVTTSTSGSKNNNISQKTTKTFTSGAAKPKKVKDDNLSLLEDTDYYEQKEKEDADAKWSLWSLLATLLVGIILGIMLRHWFPIITRKRGSKTTLTHKYTKKEALDILYPHTNDSPEIEEMVRILYKAQNDSSITIDKDKLQKMIVSVLE